VSDTPWTVAFERRASRDLRQLDPPIAERVIAAIEQLAADPTKTELRKLSGREGSRLRVGDWRVILQLNRRERQITICRVLPRGRAYDH